MDIPGLNTVYHDSHDQEIIRVINLAGAYIAATNPHHRRWDMPKETEKDKYRTFSGFAWVKTNDIGRSTTRNTKLLDRLKQMVYEGKLEIRYSGFLPRFRAVRKFRDPNSARVRRPTRGIIHGHH